jgi:hypothetical protein
MASGCLMSIATITTSYRWPRNLVPLNSSVVTSQLSPSKPQTGKFDNAITQHVHMHDKVHSYGGTR